MTTARTRAEMQIAANVRQDKRDAAHERQAKRAQAEHEIALRERADQIARLRALRLAKKAGDQERASSKNATEAASDDGSSS